MLAKSLQAAAGNAAEANYIEDVFSTWLYTGNGSTQTITNGIDLAGKGGLVWIKSRSAATNNFLFDTNRGTLLEINSNTTDAQVSLANSVTAYNAAGFSLGSAAGINVNAATYASWTFRQQPKFFDVITWTGDGASDRVISHNLGVTPGFVISKPVSVAGDNWSCQAVNALGWNSNISLNLSGANVPNGTDYLFSTGTATTLTTASTPNYINSSGVTYVAYLFAHNAGGFGLTGTDNVISCGSFTTTGSNLDVNLGYEPQMMIFKNSTAADDWRIVDNMRGWTTDGTTSFLRANTSGAETSGTYFARPTATGFTTTPITAGNTYIYIAIRRGPMKVPTTGTIVFSANATSAATGTAITTSFPVDLQVWSARASSLALNRSFIDRLRGAGTLTTDSNSPYLLSPSTAAEATDYGNTRAWSNTGFSIADVFGGINSIYWNFRRAPGFFDEVCYTGNGSTQTITHNLGVAPELIIAKNRGQAGNNWPVSFNFTSTTMGYGFLNNTTAENNQTYAYVGLFSAAPTATTLSLVNSGSMNGSGYGIVAYLFATCPGVSKVGLYTGTGTTQVINCGFTAGSRFVMIKRADGTGDWYVWDSARGIVAGDDPHLSLNTTAAEVTTDDSVDTDSTGFVVNQVAATNINVSSATYVFLAVA
jgi:hypothetical protein